MIKTLPPRSRALAAATSLVVTAAAAYAFLIRESPLADVEVPCRAHTGRVWSYVYSSGDTWRGSEHPLGADEQRAAVHSAPFSSLDCNPEHVAREDLQVLENGISESVTLSKGDTWWCFEIRDELRGVFKYEFRFIEGRVIPGKATFKALNVYSFGILWGLAFVSLALLVRELILWNRGRRDHGSLGDLSRKSTTGTPPAR